MLHHTCYIIYERPCALDICCTHVKTGRDAEVGINYARRITKQTSAFLNLLSFKSELTIHIHMYSNDLRRKSGFLIVLILPLEY